MFAGWSKVTRLAFSQLPNNKDNPARAHSRLTVGLVRISVGLTVSINDFIVGQWQYEYSIGWRYRRTVLGWDTAVEALVGIERLAFGEHFFAVFFKEFCHKCSFVIGSDLFAYTPLCPHGVDIGCGGRGVGGIGAF